MKNTNHTLELLKNLNGVIKNSVLIIATVVFGVLNANATNLETPLNTTTVSVDFTENDIVTVFDWSIKTTKGEFSGTALSLFDAKRMANLNSQGDLVLEEKITSYYVLKSEMHSKQNRIYFWEVTTKKGYAKGFSSTEFSAQKMIELVAKDAIISYKIIASNDLK
jgi:hypothetical protein